MHAEDDETIPFSQGRAVFEAARGPKKFVASPSGGHNDLPLGIGLERYLALISDFMDGGFSKK